MDALEVKHLKKQYANRRGVFTAVDDISFSLKEGEILGVLGPNGAGKTTTIQMLLGVLLPTEGEIHYFGQNLKTHSEQIHEKINFSSTYINLPWLLTVKENLTFISYLYSIPHRKKRIERIVEIFRLQEILHKDMNQLSAGQLTRVNLAKSLINFPRVLLLDEPTASLDPEVASYIREFLQEQRKQHNVSIIITSHNMGEVEELCDRVLFINHGKIVADDTPGNLAKTMEICHVHLSIDKHMQWLKEYMQKEHLQHTIENDTVLIDLKEKQIGAFLQHIGKEGVEYSELSIDKPNLEDYFIQMVKQHETT